MEQTGFLRSRKFIFLLGIILVAVIVSGTIYFANTGQEEAEGEIGPEDTAIPSPTIASSVIQSPVSPLSSISPVSPPIPVEAASEEIEAQIQQGIAFFENQNYQEALEVLNEVLVMAPNNFLAYNARGSVYVETEEYQNAIEDFSKAVELEPLFPHAYYNRGRVFRFMGRYEEAIQDLEKSVELSPTQFGYRANGNIGLIYHETGEYDKALEAFMEGISYNADERADVYYFRGETYTALENYEAAIADYQAAIERFSNYDLAYQSLGYAYYKTGQYEKALAALNQALQISPDSPIPHFYLALVYLAQEQSDEAEAEISQAVEMLDSLPEDERNFVLGRVRTNLDTLAQENPDQAGQINAITGLLPGS